VSSAEVNLGPSIGYDPIACAGDESRCVSAKEVVEQCGRAELERVALGHWACRRRQELLTMLDQLDVSIADLNQAVLEEAPRPAEVLRLMAHRVWEP
jgi:hypothetical protein